MPGARYVQAGQAERHISPWDLGRCLVIQQLISLFGQRDAT
jgi:hypothetical protein